MKEALKLELEALKLAHSAGHGGILREMKITPFTIKEALAQPEQEPLAKVEPCAVCGEGKARLLVLRSCDTCHSEYAGQAEMKVALGKPEQEPVAWIHNFIEGGISIGKRPSDLNRHPDRWTALYRESKPCPTCEALARTVMLDQTSHDTKRPWVGLTDDEASWCQAPSTIQTWKRIEAKLKEKNT